MGMRNKRTAAPLRRLRAVPVLASLTLIAIAVAALSGCSSGASSSSALSAQAEAPAPIPSASAAAAAPANGSASSGFGGSAQSVSAGRLAPTGEQLIYTAQLSVRAHSVSAAISRATSIVTAAGGYVSAENAVTNQKDPAQSTATLTLKIPVAAYAATLSELTSGLGTQLSLQQQTQDVTQQVADVSSIVASDEAAIVQLRALLKHAGSVGDLLSVQDQINNEETNLEAMLAQQNALNHETSYATVTMTLFGPKAAVKHAQPKPPPGFVKGISGGWHAFRTAVSWFLAILGAVAPFAAVVVVVGALVYWLRRRLAHRGGAGSPADS
jgi:Domain of unknown function (DUF4349)